MKRFNVTGLCVPEEDYMADISGKIEKIKELVDNRSYFTINRARQYGKTTILAALERALKDEYICLNLDFGELGRDSFANESSFCAKFKEMIAGTLEKTSLNESEIQNWNENKINTFNRLSEDVTTLCENKKVILIIDEADKTCDNKVFLDFLSMLRAKFLARKSHGEYTFHSVIFASVSDIKNIKLTAIKDGVRIPVETHNAPWNIASDFRVHMSFTPEEISAMLAEYEKDHHTGMDIAAIAEEIYSYTNGYPFLVSSICKCIDEEVIPAEGTSSSGEHKSWTTERVQKAVKKLLDESNALFDDISKNLENSKKLADFIYELLVLGEVKSYNIYNPVVSIGDRDGFLKKVNDRDRVAVSNKIFELKMIDYFIASNLCIKNQITGVLQYSIVKDSRFDMELCLRKFTQHYAELFNEKDTEFLERYGRLMFLSYLKPLINGQGFYHIESQFTDLRRMDIAVDYGREQFIIELKLWHSEKYKEEAYSQLCGYLDSKGANTGYLLTFDFRKGIKKERMAEWVEIDNKRIFDVVV